MTKPIANANPNTSPTTDDLDKETVRTNITMSAELFEWLRREAFEQRTSKSEIIRRGLLKIKEQDET